jgi:hypothetical protein
MRPALEPEARGGLEQAGPWRGSRLLKMEDGPRRMACEWQATGVSAGARETDPGFSKRPWVPRLSPVPSKKQRARHETKAQAKSSCAHATKAGSSKTWLAHKTEACSFKRAREVFKQADSKRYRTPVELERKREAPCKHHVIQRQHRIEPEVRGGLEQAGVKIRLSSDDADSDGWGEDWPAPLAEASAPTSQH